MKIIFHRLLVGETLKSLYIYIFFFSNENRMLKRNLGTNIWKIYLKRKTCIFKPDLPLVVLAGCREPRSHGTSQIMPLLQGIVFRSQWSTWSLNFPSNIWPKIPRYLYTEKSSNTDVSSPILVSLLHLSLLGFQLKRLHEEWQKTLYHWKLWFSRAHIKMVLANEFRVNLQGGKSLMIGKVVIHSRVSQTCKGAHSSFFTVKEKFTWSFFQGTFFRLGVCSIWQHLVNNFFFNATVPFIHWDFL